LAIYFFVLFSRMVITEIKIPSPVFYISWWRDWIITWDKFLTSFYPLYLPTFVIEKVYCKSWKATSILKRNRLGSHTL
jgi:hypothetical protein